MLCNSNVISNFKIVNYYQCYGVLCIKLQDIKAIFKVNIRLILKQLPFIIIVFQFFFFSFLIILHLTDILFSN